MSPKIRNFENKMTMKVITFGSKAQGACIIQQSTLFKFKSDKVFFNAGTTLAAL